MRFQQKYRIDNQLLGQLLNQVKSLEVTDQSQSIMRDWVMQPGRRAFELKFLSRYEHFGQDKGLFLRLREENNLTTREGSRQIHLFAYKIEQGTIMDDQIKVNFDTSSNNLPEMLRLLSMLGIEKTIDYTKKRETYSVAVDGRSLQVMVDTVDGLTLPFFEIQCMADKEESMEVMAAFSNLRKAIALDPSRLNAQTYFQLLLKQSGATK